MVDIAKVITSKILELISLEIQKTESQVLVREKVILPMINLIYHEIYPYLYALITAIIVILFVTLSTLIVFVAFYLKKSGL